MHGKNNDRIYATTSKIVIVHIPQQKYNLDFLHTSMTPNQIANMYIIINSRMNLKFTWSHQSAKIHKFSQKCQINLIRLICATNSQQRVNHYKYAINHLLEQRISFREFIVKSIAMSEGWWFTNTSILLLDTSWYK